MLDFLRTWLFPSTCVACDAPGAALCTGCAPGPGDALAFAVDGVPAFALGAYDGALRRAIVAMKRGERDQLEVFAGLLAARAPLEGVLVALPTTRSRAAERGFDQSVELAQRIARLRVMHAEALLRKRGSPQEGRTRLARLRATGRFRLVRTPAAKVVTLVDDVCTTGATLRDAMQVLAGAGVVVGRIVVVARTRPPRAESAR